MSARCITKSYRLNRPLKKSIVSLYFGWIINVQSMEVCKMQARTRPQAAQARGTRESVIINH